MKYLLSLIIVLTLVIPVYADAEAPLPMNATELSVEPNVLNIGAVPGDTEAESAAAVEEVAEESAFQGFDMASIKGYVQRGNPIVWGVVATILLILGVKGGKAGVSAIYAQLKDQIPANEMIGTTLMVGGVFATANGSAMGLGWSHSITNLIVAGVLTMLLGAGIAKRGDGEDKKDE